MKLDNNAYIMRRFRRDYQNPIQRRLDWKVQYRIELPQHMCKQMRKSSSIIFPSLNLLLLYAKRVMGIDEIGLKLIEWSAKDKKTPGRILGSLNYMIYLDGYLSV